MFIVPRAAGAALLALAVLAVVLGIAALSARRRGETFNPSPLQGLLIAIYLAACAIVGGIGDPMEVIERVSTVLLDNPPGGAPTATNTPTPTPRREPTVDITIPVFPPETRTPVEDNPGELPPIDGPIEIQPMQ